MLCVACGADVSVGSRFCPRCGRAVPEAASTGDNPAAPPPTAPPPSAAPPPPGPPTMPPPPPPPPSYGSGGGGYGPPPGAAGGSGGYGAPGGYSPPPGSFQVPPPPQQYPGGYPQQPYPGGYPQQPYGGGAGGPVAYGLADFGQRVGAYVIDAIIMGALFFFGLIAMVMTVPEQETSFGPEPGPSGFGVLLMFLGIAAALAYPVFFEGRPEGQTLGKKAMGIRVVRQRNGAPLGYGLAVGRVGARLVEGLIPFGIGLLWAAWDPQRQTIHDKIASTLVVKSSVYPPPNAHAPAGYQPAPPPSPYQTG